MKTFKKFINIYTVIFISVVLASLVQMNLLGKGLISSLTPQKIKAVAGISIFPSDSAEPVTPTVYNTPVLPTPTAYDTQEKTVEPTAVSFVPKRIVIKEAGIDLPVVSVPLKNGTWEVNPSVANYAEGTSLVTTKGGNVGIFGHDKSDAFKKIKTLLTGPDSYDIVLFGNNFRAIYKITTASVIAPTAVNVFYSTKEPTLTLITCDGVLSQKRYMVRAKLVKIETIKP